MKQLCLILVISMLPKIGFTQFIGDTLVVYVDNRVEIKVAIPDYNSLKSSNNVSTALKEFIRLIPEIENQLSSTSADLVKFAVDSSLTVEPGDQRYVYLIKDGETSNTGLRDQAIISGGDFEIFITTSDMSRITDLALSECLDKVIAMLPAKSNWSKSLYYECINETVTVIENKSRSNDLDFIELNLGAGAGLVKNTWVPDLSFKVGLGFKRKGVLTYNPYLSTNLLFEFDSEGNVNMNTFLNLGYSWNVDKQAAKPQMLGIELGYLISKQGNLFGENTFKLGFNWAPVKGVFVSPHLYFTDNFKTIYPGIRIGFGL